MPDFEIKKEITDDTFSKSRQKAFIEADKRAHAFIQKHWTVRGIDQTIKFLMDIQDIIGPFPVLKNIPTHLNNFKL